MPKNLKQQFETVRLVYSNPTLAKDRPQASTPQQVHKLMTEQWEAGEIDLIEEVKLLMLDRSSRLMSIYPISKGGMDMDNPTLDPKVIFAAALTRRAHHLILVQNYPGGEFNPELLDTKMLYPIFEVSELLDLPLLDYMVITPATYYSYIRGEQNTALPKPHPHS